MLEMAKAGIDQADTGCCVVRQDVLSDLNLEFAGRSGRCGRSVEGSIRQGSLGWIMIQVV